MATQGSGSGISSLFNFRVADFAKFQMVLLNSCESSCRDGPLNEDNVIIKDTALLTRIWLIFGAIQLRYGEKA